MVNKIKSNISNINEKQNINLYNNTSLIQRILFRQNIPLLNLNDILNSDFQQRQIPISNQNNQLQQLTWAEIASHNNEQNAWIVINNYVYDISKWAGKHPGGKKIILKYSGSEASDQFFAFHKQQAFERLQYLQVGQVHLSQIQESKKQTVDYRKIREYLWQNGYFQYDLAYVIRKTIVVFILLLISLLLFFKYQYYLLSSIFMGLFLHQGAFLGHDSCHYSINTQIIGGGKNLLGLFWTTVVFGISSSMWNDEHSIHHAITRRPRQDPQFDYLPIWLISIKEVTHAGFKFNWFSKFLVSFQNYTLIPLAVLIGRFNLYVLSLIYSIRKKDLYDLVAIIIYWCWYLFLVSQINEKFDRILYVLISHWVVGSLHVQLLINHLAVETFSDEEEKDEEFFNFQLKTTRNIDSDWYIHWFHGGLQFQIEHHLFPQLPRDKLAVVRPIIQDVCKKYNIKYMSEGFIETINICQKDLYQLSQMVIRGELQ